MGKFERSIRIALDKISGEILEADEVFDSKKDAFAIRRQFVAERGLLIFQFRCLTELPLCYPLR